MKFPIPFNPYLAITTMKTAVTTPPTISSMVDLGWKPFAMAAIEAAASVPYSSDIAVGWIIGLVSELVLIVLSGM